MSKKLRKILMLLCACIFLYSALQLGKYYLDYKKGESIYNEAKEYAFTAGAAEESEEKGKVAVDFESLKSINEDIFAWIRMENTPVDYPVLLGRDNAYYLNRTYDHQYSSFGSIFLEMTNEMDFSDSHTILYGHNMKNKSMFGSLSSFQKQDFFEAHKQIHIYLPEGELIYEIFSVYTAYVLDPTYELTFADENEFQNLLNHMTNSSVITSQKEISTEDKILTLSTCTSDNSVNYRFVVNALLIEDNRE